jgi:hypothetical protein
VASPAVWENPISTSATAATASVLRQRVRAGGLGPGQLGKLADHDIDRRAEQEAGDHGTREELRDPPHSQHRDQEEQDTRSESDHDQGRDSDPGDQVTPEPAALVGTDPPG